MATRILYMQNPHHWVGTYKEKITVSQILTIFICFVVSSGSITINDDSSVQILAEEAVNLEDLDAAVSSLYNLMFPRENAQVLLRNIHVMCRRRVTGSMKEFKHIQESQITSSINFSFDLMIHGVQFTAFKRTLDWYTMYTESGMYPCCLHP